MMLKEKTAENKTSPKNKNKEVRTAKMPLSPIIRMITCCAAGFFLSGALGGGAGIPLCVPLISVLGPFGGLCVFTGAAASYVFTGTSGGFLTDIAAMPVMLGIRFFADRYFSPKTAALISGIIYIVCGGAAAFASEITGTLIAAVFFRGVICAAVSYFAADCARGIRDGGKIYVTGEKAVGTAVLYVLIYAALSPLRISGFCPVRAAGMFVILAAGGRFGGGGAAAAGALAAIGVILGETRGTDLSEMVRGSALMTCSGLVSGYFSRRSRTAEAAAFSVSMLLLTLFMGRMAWASAIMTDTLAAAAMYCLIPDNLYSRFINGTLARGASAAEHCAQSLSLASYTLRDINERISGAAAMLAEINGGGYDTSEEICAGICSSCRNDTFCCKGSVHRAKYILPDTVRIFKNKGYITEKELPKALEGCTKKDELVLLLNELCAREAMNIRRDSFSEQLRLNMSEQLSVTDEMLDALGRSMSGMTYDPALSGSAERIMKASGADKPSAAVFYDSAGHIYISCFYKGSLGVPVTALTDKLSRLADRDLEPPEAFSENGMTRLRWHEMPVFAYETGKASVCGREEISGDSSIEFSDGFGNVYFIISDGMGSGSRAALESSMTVSVLSRLIRAGADEAAAVRLVNIILLSKSDDEVLSTVDMLKLNLFSGRADMIKAGAPRTFFSTGGSVKTVGGGALPAGIISPMSIEKKHIRLSDGDCAVMLSDGIGEESIPKVRELILSEGYSPDRCARAIVDYDKKEEKFPADDRTVIVVKLHKL